MNQNNIPFTARRSRDGASFSAITAERDERVIRRGQMVIKARTINEWQVKRQIREGLVTWYGWRCCFSVPEPSYIGTHLFRLFSHFHLTC